MGCGDRSIAFFEEHPSSSETSMSRRGQQSYVETSSKTKRHGNREVDELSNVEHEELETIAELSKACSQIVLKMRVFGTNWWT